MFESIKLAHRRHKLDALAATLGKKGYTVHTLDSAADINACVLAQVKAGDQVGLGGSVTIRQLGLDVLLQQQPITLHDHWLPDLTPAQVAETIRRQPGCDCFITSTNGISMEGQLVNIDGTGNRVASMIFGPRRVIAIVGYNKIAETLDQTMARVKDTACPLNSRRKNFGHPCEKAGHCVSCRNEKSMCMVTAIIDHRPPGIDFHIILTPLELGF